MEAGKKKKLSLLSKTRRRQLPLFLGEGSTLTRGRKKRARGLLFREIATCAREGKGWTSAEKSGLAENLF